MEKNAFALMFVCPIRNEVFESSDFKILENNGVATDEFGNKMLDMKIELNAPCPFCGQKHTFHAKDLSCPFESSGTLR